MFGRVVCVVLCIAVLGVLTRDEVPPSSGVALVQVEAKRINAVQMRGRHSHRHEQGLEVEEVREEPSCHSRHRCRHPRTDAPPSRTPPKRRRHSRRANVYKITNPRHTTVIQTPTRHSLKRKSHDLRRIRKLRQRLERKLAKRKECLEKARSERKELIGHKKLRKRHRLEREKIKQLKQKLRELKRAQRYIRHQLKLLSKQKLKKKSKYQKLAQLKQAKKEKIEQRRALEMRLVQMKAEQEKAEELKNLQLKLAQQKAEQEKQAMLRQTEERKVQERENPANQSQMLISFNLVSMQNLAARKNKTPDTCSSKCDQSSCGTTPPAIGCESTISAVTLESGGGAAAAECCNCQDDDTRNLTTET